MQNGARLLRIVSSLLVSGNLLCAGCSALIAYSGEDIGKLGNKTQVHESFSTPSRIGDEGGVEFEEYCTRRKISEPQVATVDFILGAETLGLFELWMFPAAVCQNVRTTLVGQTLRFEYAQNGDVKRLLIDGTPMELRAQLP
jgi:hypothetical protein